MLDILCPRLLAGRRHRHRQTGRARFKESSRAPSVTVPLKVGAVAGVDGFCGSRYFILALLWQILRGTGFPPLAPLAFAHPTAFETTCSRP
jgi:hypothetical protein